MPRRKTLCLLLAVITAAFVLRSPLTGVGSLITGISGEFGLSAGLGGAITTIPLLAFAAVSPLVGRLEQRTGAGRLMCLSLCLLTLGLLVRSYTGVAGLFLGTAVAGVAIAFGNVLIPAVIKSEFPTKVGLATGLYTSSMGAFAALSAGVSVPLAGHTGWRGALAVWLFLALLALAWWLPQWRLKIKTPPNGCTSLNLRRTPLAWWVTLYMGVQSFLFYCFVAWLPAMLQAKGVEAASAGYYALLYQLASIPASFGTPLLAAKRPSQRGLATLVAALYCASMVLFGLAQARPLVLLGTALTGFCSGATLSLAMSMFALRTPNAQLATRLSGMAQSVGYLVAALGPFLLGFLYDHSHSWDPGMVCLVADTLILLVIGLQAGAPKVIGSGVPNTSPNQTTCKKS